MAKSAQYAAVKLPAVIKPRSMPRVPVARPVRYAPTSIKRRKVSPILPLKDVKPESAWWEYPLEGLQRLAYAGVRAGTPTETEMEEFRQGKRRMGGLHPVEAAKSLIPFGETLGLYKKPKDWETPYELVSSTVRSKMIAKGFDPDSAAVRWGGRLIGFAADIPSDILFWTGASLAPKAAPKTAIGKAFRGAFELAPEALARRVTAPVSAAARAIPGLGVFGREITAKGMISYPFALSVRTINKWAAGSGRVGQVAQSLQKVGKWFERAFTFRGVNRITQQAIRRMASLDYGFEKAVEALDNPTVRRLSAFAHAPRVADAAWKNPRHLADFLKRIGPQRAKVAMREVYRLFASDLPEVMTSVMETKRLANAVRSLKLTPDARGIFFRWAGEMKTQYDQILKIKQMIDIAERAGNLDAITLSSMETMLHKSGRKPLTGGQIKGLVSWRVQQAKAAERALVLAKKLGASKSRLAELKAMTSTTRKVKGLTGTSGIAATFPSAMTSPRIAYAKHAVIAKSVRDMDAGDLWGKWGDELRKILRDNSPHLSSNEIENLVQQTMVDIGQARKIGAEFPRLPVSAHMTVEEINAAAHRAGLKPSKMLMSPHAGEALAVKGGKDARRITFFQLKQGIVHAAANDASVSAAQQNLNRYLTPRGIQRNTKAYGKLKDWVGLRVGTKRLAGYMLIRDVGNKWRILDEDMGHVVANISQMLLGAENYDTVLRKALWAWDIGTKHMKSFALDYSVGYHFRNMVDDLIRMFVGEGTSTVADGLSMVGAIERGKSVTIKFADKAIDFNLGNTHALLAEAGKIGGYAVAEVSLKEAPWNTAKQASRAFGNWSENMRSSALMLGVMQKNSHLTFANAFQKAAASVRDILYAYPEITSFEKAVPARFIFFYRFMRKNIPFQLRAFVEHPFRQLLVVRGAGRIAGLPEDKEDVYMPNWLRARGAFPVKRAGEMVTYNPGLGLSVFDVLSKFSPSRLGEEWMSSLTPFARMPLELVADKSFFIERRISQPQAVYSAPVAKALSVVNPVFEKLVGMRMVKKVKSGNKEYWSVPGHVMWGISQVRPFNDLIKLLSMVAPSGSKKGSIGDAVRWVITGQKEKTYNMRIRRQMVMYDNLQEMQKLLEQMGYLRIVPQAFPVRGMELTPDETTMVGDVRLQQRALQQRSRMRRRVMISQ